MEKTAKNKRKIVVPGSLRHKLTAALCMLLVSAIMMVSSTYAWFTLSTAPEVTNISTTVSGNGSLEIALMPNDGLVGSIAKGTSGTDKKISNVSWGNIVELQDSYGLEGITLKPAMLDTTDAASLAELLQIPVFGADGRIEKLDQATGWAKYDAGTGADATFVKIDGSAYGVRAIAEGAQDGATAGAKIVPYGYVVDLAFRINTDNNGTAAKLMLSEAQQRIAGSNNANTMGGGTTMTVKPGAGVTLDTAKKMMNAINITFVKDFGVSTGTPTVIATGRMDTNGTLTANADGAYEVPIHLYTKTTTTTGEGADAITTTSWTSVADDVLAELPKNQAVQISAIVWMSGADLKNDAFAIDGNTLTGTLNLQFTTDVELKPAQNAELFEMAKQPAGGTGSNP